MELSLFPQKALQVLLQDAFERDPVTARRAHLVRILLHERYLSRQQLIVRVEGLLGKGCFGDTAWQDTFYRDMRVVKKTVQAAGYRLKYSRQATRAGYYLYQQPPISAELAATLAHSVAEVDMAQIKIWRRMAPAERFRLGCSITDAAKQATDFRRQFLATGLATAKKSAGEGKP